MVVGVGATDGRKGLSSFAWDEKSLKKYIKGLLRGDSKGLHEGKRYLNYS